MLLKELYQSMHGKLNEAEVDDDQMIKFKSSDGENKEMPASSAKKMEKDHPAKLAYDKMAGGDDDDGDTKKGVNIFDPEQPADEPSDMDTGRPDYEDEDEPDYSGHGGDDTSQPYFDADDEGGEGSDDDWDKEPVEPGEDPDGRDYAKPGDDDWEDEDEPSDDTSWGKDAEDAAGDIDEWMPEDAFEDWQEMMNDDPDVDDVVDFIVNNETGLEQHYSGDIEDLARQFTDKEGSKEPSDTGTEKPDHMVDSSKMFDDMDIDYEETEDENGNKKYELEDGRELTFTDTGVVIDDDGNEEIDQWPYPPENYGFETVKDPEADWRDLPVVPHDQWAEESQDYLSKRFPEENKEERIPGYGSFQETQVKWVKDNITFKD
jgi:hypothetical protein